MANKDIFLEKMDMLNDLINTKANITGKYTIDGMIRNLSGLVPTGGAKLNSPMISLASSYFLNFVDGDNGTFSNNYEVYVDETLLTIVSVSTQSIDLRNYQISAGTHTITVKVNGTNMTTSDASNSVTYTSTSSQYSITYSLTNAEREESSPTSINQNESAYLTIVANYGYLLPENASSINVVNAEKGSYVVYNDSVPAACILEIRNATGNVTVSLSALTTTFSVSTTVTNGTYTGSQTIQTGGTGTVVISPNTGYGIPSNVVVVGAEYTYDSTTGTVSLSNPRSDVSIQAVCVPVSYTISYLLTNMTLHSSSPTIIDAGGSVTITILANTGYKVPETSSSIHVTNATIINYHAYNDYTPPAFMMQISNPTGNVTVEAAGVPVEPESNFVLSNGDYLETSENEIFNVTEA